MPRLPGKVLSSNAQPRDVLYMKIPGGGPERGGWARLDLTDALSFILSTLHYRWDVWVVSEVGFCKKYFAKCVHMCPPCQCIFFTIDTRNVMILHVHVIQSSLVFLLIKVIDECKKLLKIRHFMKLVCSYSGHACMNLSSAISLAKTWLILY
jgi:hypothetical protein